MNKKKLVEILRMKPLERAVRLKEEADALLREIQLDELCLPIGKLTPTGSYSLDLMIYPDIDLYLPPARPRQLFEIAAYLVENHPVIRVNFLRGGPVPLKDALYIKPVIAIGNWERPWKIDIWAVDSAFIDEKTAELESFKARMTPEIREFILNFKYSILNEEGRTPMFSGIHIYRAVFDLNLRTDEELNGYLKDQGIGI